MSDFLGIDLVAGLNEVQSKTKIDSAIKTLSTKLDELKINLDIDQKALQTIKTFNTEMKKLSQVAEKAGQTVKQVMSPSGSEDMRSAKMRETIQQIQKIESAQKKQGATTENELRKESRRLSELLSQYTHLNRVTDTRNKEGSITGQRYDVGDKHGDITGSIFTNKEGEVIRDTFAENLEKNNRRVAKAANDRDDIFRQLHNINNKYHNLVDPKTMKMLSQQAEKGTTDSLASLKKNVGEYDKHLSSMSAGNKRLEGIANTRQNLHHQLASIQHQHGDNVDPKKMQMFNQQILKGDTESLKKLSRNISDYGKSMTQLQQVQAFQQDMFHKMRTLDFQTVGNISPEYQKQLNGIWDSTKGLSQETENFAGKKKKLEQSFRGVSQEIRKADQGMARFSGQLFSAMARIPIYAAGMAAMYAPLRMFKSAIEQIIEIDTQMTVLERVTDGAENMNTAMASSIDIAERLGNQIAEVNEGLINFARQGYRGEDLTAITEVATVMSNVSDLNVEDAASSLTAAMKGFNIEAQDSLRIVDSLNEVDNNYSVTTQQLAQALMRSAGAASTYGVTLERSIGYTTAISEVTREAGNVVGNSLKSIYSRITSIPEAVEAMAEVGVSINDMNGGLRDVDDILGDLGGKWSGLSREQQQNIGLQVAGRYQLSRFLILMENWDQALSATDSALHSNGSAMRENEKYMDSYEAKINKVKNAWTESTMALQEDFLGDAILGFTTTATSFISVFTTVIDKVGLLPTVLGAAGIALSLFGVNINNLARKGLNVFATGIAGAVSSLAKFSAQAHAGATSSNALAIGFSGLRVAATGLMATLGPMAILMAAGWGVSKLIERYSEAKQYTEELRRETDSLVDSYRGNTREISSLVEEHRRLHDITDKTTNQEKKYQEVANELGELLPSIVEEKDKEGNARLLNAEAIDKEIKSLRELSTIDARQFIDSFSDMEDDITDKISGIEKKISDLGTATHFGVTYDITDRGTGNLPISQQRESIVLTRQQEAAQADLNQLYIEYGEAVLEREGVFASLSDSQKEYIQTVLDEGGQTEETLEKIEYFTGTIASLTNEFNELENVDVGWVVQYGIESDISEEKLRELASTLADLKGVFAEGFSFDIIDDMSKLDVVKDITTAIDEGGDKWHEYAGSLKDVGLTSDETSQVLGFLRHTANEIAVAARDMGEDVDATQPVFDSLGEKITNFATAAQLAGDETDEFSGSMEGAEETAHAYAQALENAENATWDNVSASEMLTGVTHEQVSLMEQAIQVVQALGDQSDLTAQQKEYLTEAVNFLTNMYPHLDGAISENISWLVDEANMLSQLSGASGDNADVMMSNQDSVTTSTINASNQRIKKLISEANTLRQLVSNYEKAQRAKVIDNIMNPTKPAKLSIDDPDLMGALKFRAPSFQTIDPLTRMRRQAQAELEQVEADLNAAYSTRQSVSYGGGGLKKSSKLLSQAKKKPTGSKKKPKKSSGGSKSGADKAKREAEQREREAAKLAEEAQRRVLEIVNAQIDAYGRKADVLNANIAHEEYYLSKYESTSQQYRQRQQNIAQLKKQQADYHLDTIRYIEGQLKGNKRLNTEQRRELQKTLTSTKQTYYSALQSVESINKDIKKSYEDIADEFIQLYKDVHEEMKKVALKANQDELDSLQKNFDKKIDMLDEELFKYEEIIQAKLDLIDDEKDQEDFQSELNKKQEERIDLIRQIDILSMDDSMEARNKVAELKEFLDEKDLEIKEFVADRERELRKQSLVEQLEDKREQIESEQEMEEEKFDEQKLKLEEQRETIEQHYEDLLNDERKFAKMRQDILNGNIKSMTKMLKGFSSDIGKNMNTIGKSISNNLIDRISEAQKKLNSVTKSYEKMETKTKTGSKSPSKPKASPSTSKTSSKSKNKSPKVGGRVKVNTKNANAYMDSYGKQVRPWAQQAKAAGVGYGQGLHMVNKRGDFAALSKTNSINGAIAWVKTKDLVGLNTGGMTGNFQGGRIAELHSNELVSNPVDTKNLISASKFASDFISKIPKLLSGGSDNSTSNTNHNNIELNIEMNEVNDSESLFKEINDSLGGMGVKFIR